MSDMRDPATDQPLPEPGKVAVHQAVIEALDEWAVPASVRRRVQEGLAARLELGTWKYGRPLESYNGRDALRDAWEEALDCLVYVYQMRLEGQESDHLLVPLVHLLDGLARRQLEREARNGG